MYQARQQVHCPVNHHHVQPPIVVKIDPRGAETRKRQTRWPETGTYALVLEQPVPIVYIDGVGLSNQMRNEQIVVAVAVKISSIDSHPRFSIAGLIQRRPIKQRRVNERTVSLVHPTTVL